MKSFLVKPAAVHGLNPDVAHCALCVVGSVIHYALCWMRVRHVRCAADAQQMHSESNPPTHC